MCTIGRMDIHLLARQHLDEKKSLRELARQEKTTVHRLSRLLREAGYSPRTRAEATSLANQLREWEKTGITNFEAQKRLRGRKLEIVRAFRARGCKCGEKHPAALDLHHRDPATKHHMLRPLSLGGSRRRGSSSGRGWVYLSYADLQAELAKCDVLCSNCHRIETWEARQREAA